VGTARFSCSEVLTINVPPRDFFSVHWIVRISSGRSARSLPLDSNPSPPERWLEGRGGGCTFLPFGGPYYQRAIAKGFPGAVDSKEKRAGAR